MSKYTRLKTDLMLFNKNAIPLKGGEFSITVAEGTIVQTDYWSSGYRLITSGSYNSVCRKTDLEFLE